jgi:3-hydroxyisobutyrate dehydrogenase
MGEVGSGQLTKMCNQIAIAGVVQGVAEALHFAKRAGLPTDDVLAAISKGAAQSWQMENRWPTMARASSTSASPSTGCARTSASPWTKRPLNGAKLPATALIDQFYAEVQAMGGNRWDTSSLVARLEK